MMHPRVRDAARRVPCLAAGVAVCLALTSPALARSAGPGGATSCSDQTLIGRFGAVTVAPGHWCVVGFSTVHGSIDVTRASAFYLFASSVSGDVTITGTTSSANAAILPGLAAIFPGIGPADSICTTSITGNLTITASGPAAPWNIGGTNYPPFLTNSTCARPISVLGNLTFDDNAGAPNEIASSDIGGNLECSGNGNFTTGVLTPYQKNRVGGTSSGQCAGLAIPAATSARSPVVPRLTQGGSRRIARRGT
jgi:hypothetical protein